MSRSSDFSRAPEPKGRLVRSRFNLRREPETKRAQAPEVKPVVPYSSPGRGQNGESSN